MEGCTAQGAMLRGEEGALGLAGLWFWPLLSHFGKNIPPTLLPLQHSSSHSDGASPCVSRIPGVFAELQACSKPACGCVWVGWKL